MKLTYPLMPAKNIYHSINSTAESLQLNIFFCLTMLYTPPSPCFLCPTFFTFWYFPAPPQLLHCDVLVLSVKITVFIGLVLLHVLYDKLQKNNRITLVLTPQENDFLWSSSLMPYHVLFAFRLKVTLSEGLLVSKIPFNIMQIFIMQKGH